MLGGNVLLAAAVIALLAGCVAPAGSPRDAAAAPASPPGPGGGARAVHVEATMRDPGSLGPDTAECAGASCQTHASGIAYLHGDINGTYAYHSATLAQPDGSLHARDDGWFVGAIAGCGAGALAMVRWVNTTAAGATTGALLLRGPTATEGLAGIAGALALRGATLAGDITCPPPRAAAEAPGREVRVAFELRDPGLTRADAAGCAAPATGCRFHVTGIAYFSGGIVGTYAYHAWGEPQPNGSMRLGDDGRTALSIVILLATLAPTLVAAGPSATIHVPVGHAGDRVVYDEAWRQTMTGEPPIGDSSGARRSAFDVTIDSSRDRTGAPHDVVRLAWRASDPAGQEGSAFPRPDTASADLATRKPIDCLATFDIQPARARPRRRRASARTRRSSRAWARGARSRWSRRRDASWRWGPGWTRRGATTRSRRSSSMRPRARGSTMAKSRAPTPTASWRGKRCSMACPRSGSTSASAS